VLQPRLATSVAKITAAVATFSAESGAFHALSDSVAAAADTQQARLPACHKHPAGPSTFGQKRWIFLNAIADGIVRPPSSKLLALPRLQTSYIPIPMFRLALSVAVLAATAMAAANVTEKIFSGAGCKGVPSASYPIPTGQCMPTGIDSVKYVINAANTTFIRVATHEKNVCPSAKTSVVLLACETTMPIADTFGVITGCAQGEATMLYGCNALGKACTKRVALPLNTCIPDPIKMDDAPSALTPLGFGSYPTVAMTEFFGSKTCGGNNFTATKTPCNTCDYSTKNESFGFYC
jgi:hypothetical protein